MYQIKELSLRSGVPPKTIRYYEQIGLLAPAKRGDNRYRLYDEQDVEQLRFIGRARALDFSLQEIAQILATRDRGEPPCGHVVDILRDHIAEIETRIRDLEVLREELTTLYQVGQGLPEDVLMRQCVCHLIKEGVDWRGDHD